MRIAAMALVLGSMAAVLTLTVGCGDRDSSQPVAPVVAPVTTPTGTVVLPVLYPTTTLFVPVSPTGTTPTGTVGTPYDFGASGTAPSPLK